MAGKLFKKATVRIITKHVNENLLHVDQFGFGSHHSMAFHCMRLMDCVTLNFNNSMSVVAVFLDIKRI
jgi:hypothetical protein